MGKHPRALNDLDGQFRAFFFSMPSSFSKFTHSECFSVRGLKATYSTQKYCMLRITEPIPSSNSFTGELTPCSPPGRLNK